MPPSFLPIALVECAHPDMCGVPEDIELGADRDIDGRSASTSPVIGGEAGDPAGGFGAWIIGWGRKWSAEREDEIVAESMQPGIVVSRIARRCNLTPQQLFTW